MSYLYFFPFLSLNKNKQIIEFSEGEFVKLNKFCEKRMKSDSKCVEHYNNLCKSEDGWHHCPYGYSSYIYKDTDKTQVFTGIIPFPRFNTPQEKERAKTSTHQKVERTSVEKNRKIIFESEKRHKELVGLEVTNSLAALHEVRKYNRNLKRSLENFCRDTSPQNPDKADRRIVNAWKISEFMTAQFDILSLIANEELTKLEIKTKSNIYKIFDKCVQLFKHIESNKKITLKDFGDSPIAIVSDKTFPIMATVLIDNALKYCADKSEVTVEVKIIERNKFRVTITNQIPHDTLIPQDPFKRGIRGDSTHEGSGVGLYLAQLVAKQHGTLITCKRHKLNDNFDSVEFEFIMNSIN